MERIPLGNTAFEGRNNVYCFSDGSETTLLDTGVATDVTREQLYAELGERGIEVADIDQIILTHWHQDHAGLAGEIQRASGASVHVHEADAPLVAHDDDAREALHRDQRAYFDRWGMPTEKQEELLAFFEANTDSAGEPADVEPFADGTRFDVGEMTLEAMHAPGHTAGLCYFVGELDGERVVFSGDAVLPVYTPNVGGADVRVEEPLSAYLDSLRRFADASFDRAFPGHRDPIDDPTGRAEAIVEHHEERAYRVLRVLAEQGPSTVWAVSDALFGDLSAIHILHGPGEAFAHLDHLHRAGDVKRDGEEYDLTDETRERMERPEADRWPL